MAGNGLRALDALFSLRVNLHDGTRLMVTAFDLAQFREDGTPIYSGSHHAITWEARHVTKDGAVTLYEKCESWLGIPAHQSIDGNDAKEGVLFAIGHADSEDPETHREFAATYGETLAMIREERYGSR